MGRTASPVTPGTSPAASNAADDTSTDTGDSLLDTSTGAAEGKDAGTSEMDAMRAQIEEMKALLRQVTRNQATATAMPVKLPTMADVLKQKPTVAVLTEEGWFVPAVHPTDRLTKA